MMLVGSDPCSMMTLLWRRGGRGQVAEVERRTESKLQGWRWERQLRRNREGEMERAQVRSGGKAVYK